MVGQVVLVVIDALRADFVFEKVPSEFALKEQNDLPKIQYLSELIDRGQAVPCAVHVQSPTVTLPRIKTIVSGAISGMGDFVANFLGGDSVPDNLISGWKRANRTLTMFGDDTWLRTFPGAFSRADGTHSFFVLDFHEVDDNVTRHVDSEMSKDDWDVAILHFLGLDHIGHVQGPRGPQIPGKLREMGQILRRIADHLAAKSPDRSPPLLLVVGDHGMADDRGHGGSSPPETSTPAVFVFPTLNLASNPSITPINQQDLAPTLALLTDIPIPTSSVGLAVPSVLDIFGQREFGDFYNAHQIAALFAEVFPDETQLYSEFLTAKDLRLTALKMASKLQENMVKYRVEFVVLSLFVLAFVLVFSMAGIQRGWDNLGLVLAVFSAGRSASYLSTSLIEEEHQTLYFLATTSLIILLLETRSKVKIAMALVVLAVARRWNQTGDKWRHLPDIADVLTQSTGVLTVIHFTSMLGIVFIRSQQSWTKLWTFLPAIVSIYLHHATSGLLYRVWTWWPLNEQ